jgi:hypothetical protein
MSQFSAACLLLSAWMLTAGESAAQSKSAAWTTPSAEQVTAVYPEIESLYIDFAPDSRACDA